MTYRQLGHRELEIKEYKDVIKELLFIFAKSAPSLSDSLSESQLEVIAQASMLIKES